MLKKNIEFVDFEGEKQVSTEYFNMTRMELLNFQDSVMPENFKDLQEYINDIVDKQDIRGMFKVIKAMVLLSYGKKSEDGKHFLKNAAIREEFESSLAYSALIESFFEDQDGKVMTSFVEGIINSIPKESTAASFSIAE